MRSITKNNKNTKYEYVPFSERYSEIINEAYPYERGRNLKAINDMIDRFAEAYPTREELALRKLEEKAFGSDSVGKAPRKLPFRRSSETEVHPVFSNLLAPFIRLDV